MKKFLVALCVLCGAAAAWYLLSPLWRVQVADDVSPISSFAERSLSAEEQSMLDEAMRESAGITTLATDAMPKVAHVVAEGLFVPRAHAVQGKAILIEQDGNTTLRFEDFDTINGPNLHVYLSADLEGKDYKDLGAIRATRGNVNYPVDAAIDTEKYRHVLVWCVPFGIVFSSASL